MVAATPNAALAMTRDLMDKALASADGVRVTYLDAKYGGREQAHKEARRWQQRVYTARSGLRRMVAKINAGVDDVSVLALNGKANAIDTYAVEYDKLYAGVDRNADDTGWWLTIRRADLSALDVEIL